MSPNQGAAANRRPAGQSDGSAFAKATADKSNSLSAPKAFGVAADPAHAGRQSLRLVVRC